ncbi:galactose-1-phosphate uridylyltransferase [Streptococcus pneumoniae 3051]|nr:galactose-1-phosphate uridylyltransferase [Streptococcus pneumoniae 3051]
MQTQEKHSQAAVLGLQHLLAMYSGSILVPIMIATALGYSAEQLTYLISTDIFMCGVATFLQLQLNKYFGIGLPVVLGVAFQSVAPLIMIGQSMVVALCLVPLSHLGFTWFLFQASSQK